MSALKTRLASTDPLFHYFSTLNPRVFESTLKCAGLGFFQFSSQIEWAPGRLCDGHGADRDRRIAAQKCVAEALERRFMIQFFTQNSHRPDLPPGSLRSSNGWAVHHCEQDALERAKREATERHLLLLSFFKFGWNGFHLQERRHTKDLDLNFLKARFVTDRYAAGMVIAKTPNYPGASFGYCVGERTQSQDYAFWEPAILEASGKILQLGGRAPDAPKDHDWMAREEKYFLENPLMVESLDLNGQAETLETPCASYAETFNLEGDLGFPFWAAFAWGGDLIPLNHVSALGSLESQYLAPILFGHNLTIRDLPERCPII